MSKAKNKTQATTASAADYLAAIDDDKRRAQCETVSELMARITKRPATMWGHRSWASASITTPTTAGARATFY